MLDKLALTSPKTELTQELACQLLKGHFSKCTLTGTKYHQTVLSFYQLEGGKHLLSLHLQPRHSHISQLKIEINPTHFSGFKDMTMLLGLFAEPNDLKISRIDHSVDLEGVNVGDIYSSLILSRKKSKEVYSDGINIESFYFGKAPEKLLVYDKAKELKELELVRTRIELQQSREKVPFNRYTDLPRYRNFAPFQKLQFKMIDPSVAHSLRDHQKQTLINDWLMQQGAQTTYKVFNRHSNFRRDISPMLIDDNRIPDLDKVYQQNLGMYFL